MAAGEYPATPAHLVLDMQTRLQESLAHPNSKLVQYFHGFYQDTVEKAAARAKDAADAKLQQAATWGYMFYPAQDSEEFSHLLSKQIFSARTYQVTADMVDAVSATYEKTADRVGHIAELDVPAGAAGFVWLDKPLYLLDGRGKKVVHRAISWDFQAIKFRHGTEPGVRITTWTQWDDQDDYYDARIASAMEAEIGPLIMGHCVITPFGQRFALRSDRVWENAEAGDFKPDDVTRWLHTLWMFLEAEITVSTPVSDVGRQTRKRALRVLKGKPEVNVVMLRRIHNTAEPSGEHREVDWSCCWMVQGFYRHLDHYDGPKHHAVPGGAMKRGQCLVCSSRITWVKPHIRGPEDKPLRAAPQLYRLAR